jgi:flagellar hook-associated protein 2
MATTPITASSSATGTTTAAQLAAANKASAQKIITSLSAGSGVDVASLAQNLVEAERAPKVNAINAKISKNENKVSGISAVMFMMSELKTAMTAVKDKDSFNTVTATGSNTAAFGVTASTAAAAGSHNISVTSLSAAQRSVSTGFATASTSLNGGQSFSLQINGTNTAGLSLGAPVDTATNVAFINGPTFATNASVNDFKTFSVTVDGKGYKMTPSPNTPTLADLASNLQAQLRAQDGSNDLSVTVSGGNNLSIQSLTSTRVITAPSLSNGTTINLDSGASIGVSTGASITGASFGTPSSSSDFSGFSVSIGGTVRSIVPDPASSNMESLAANIQSQLRTLDGNTDISVSYTGSALTLTSASNKAITAASLTKRTYPDTPSGLVDAINSANRGYKAQLVNDGSSSTPFKVVVKGANGSSEGFVLAATSATNLGFAVPAGFEASDAVLNVDGVNYTRKTNTITDVVDGLTLDLKAPTNGAASIVVNKDTSAIKTKLTALVTAYNDFNDIVNQTTDPKSTLETYGATLVGDSTVRMVRQQMRSIILGVSSTPGTGVRTMSDLGFSLDQKGVMSLDAAKLDKVLASNYDDVTKMFTGGFNNLSTYSNLPAGIAGDAVKKLTNLLAASGPLMTKSENANTENTKYQTELTKLQARMDSLLTRYQKQFAAMESMVGSVNSQKTSLKSTFDAMMAAYTNK